MVGVQEAHEVLRVIQVLRGCEVDGERAQLVELYVPVSRGV